MTFHKEERKVHKARRELGKGYTHTDRTDKDHKDSHCKSDREVDNMELGSSRSRFGSRDYSFDIPAGQQ